MSTLMLVGSRLALAFVNPDEHQGKLTETAALGSNAAPAQKPAALPHANLSASSVNSSADDAPVIWHSLSPNRTNTSELWNTMPREDVAPDDASELPAKGASAAPVGDEFDSVHRVLHRSQSWLQSAADERNLEPAQEHALEPAMDSMEGDPKSAATTPSKHAVLPAKQSSCVDDTTFTTIRYLGEAPEEASAPLSDEKGAYCATTIELSNPDTPDGALARIYGVYTAEKGNPGVYINVCRCPSAEMLPC